MKRVESVKEYDRIVGEVGQIVEKEGSVAEAANKVIADIKDLGPHDGTAVLTNGEPYIDERISPTSVFSYTYQTYPYRVGEGFTYRQTAVKLFANDLDDYINADS